MDALTLPNGRMEDEMSEKEIDRMDIAQVLGYDPSQEESWPTDLVDRLALLYKHRGSRAFYEEDQRTITRPIPKHNG